MATQTTTQIAREAPYLEDYRRRLLESTFGLADKPISQFQRGIAEFAPTEAAAFSEAARQMGIDPKTGQRTGVASFEPFIQQAQATMGLGIPSLQQAQAQYDPATANTQAFMNQYQADVTQQALKQLDEEAAKASAQLAGQATKAGAFGGARYGVQQAELAKNLQDIKSRRIFEDLSKNFLQAQQASIGTSEAARGRQLQAAPVYGQLGQGIGQLGAQQFGLGQQGIGSLLSAGQTERTRQQAIEDELFRFRTTAAQEPRTRLGFTADILAGVPSVQQTVTQQPIPYTNPLAAAVGAGIAGLGGLGALYGG
tara:strand:+ start:159 stop:1091 length:933 start_codon:yes stop_codon:yes gene_type:complete